MSCRRLKEVSECVKEGIRERWIKRREYIPMSY